MSISVSRALSAAVGVTAAALLLTACGSSASSGGDVLDSVPAGTHFSQSPTEPAGPPVLSAKPAPNPSPAQILATGGNGRAVNAVANPAFPSPSTSVAAPTPPPAGLPTPTGPVTYVSWAFARPYNCREHADLVDTAPDVSTELTVTVLLDGVSPGALSIVAPNAAIRTLPTTSSLLSSKAVGSGRYVATYSTFVSLFHPNFPAFSFSSLAAVAGSAHYTISFPSPATVTLDDCHP